ncbi:diacylglycerol/lipid kinase family protein [Limnochorda pilosa]|uniref:Diacylglycerol kinase n=1 Tax=Limnochorda pilosa TaxID=1555112 RepID=A0A0K2SPC0_LIMPI|nr:diacylglycerol kinase family protein [Limnochorda pilosa]BAS28847.1 diacylglycerol kinase [Limnochorda pilosa]
MEAFFVVNPVAGSGRARRAWNRLQDLVGAPLPSSLTRAPGQAVELALGAAHEGYPLVVAVGGDGTANEVVNGLMQLPPERRPAFGQVSCGTGNDFARNTGIPRRLETWLRLLREPHLRPLDLGRVNGRYFLNITGVGFDAEVAHLGGQLPTFIPGTFNYMVAILAQLATYRNQLMRIRVDGRSWEERCLLVAVGNLPHCAGGLNLCPTARADDGLLETVVVGDLTRSEVLRVLPRVFPGTHVRHPKVQVLAAREVEVDSDAPLHWQADGEVMAGLPARLDAHPAAIQLLAPAAAAAAGLPQAAQRQAEPSLPRHAGRAR